MVVVVGVVLLVDVVVDFDADEVVVVVLDVVVAAGALVLTAGVTAVSGLVAAVVVGPIVDGTVVVVAGTVVEVVELDVVDCEEAEVEGTDDVLVGVGTTTTVCCISLFVVVLDDKVFVVGIDVEEVSVEAVVVPSTAVVLELDVSDTAIADSEGAKPAFNFSLPIYY